MSHLKCLEEAKNKNLDHILIVEDDIKFLDPNLFTSKINFFLENHENWDVLLIGGNIIPPYISVDESCVKVINCQTTTGYLIKNHYFDKLIENYKEGIQNLIKCPEEHKNYAIDKYWFKLQEIDNWYLIIPLTVTQREDYSDIEKRPINYSNVMLDLDKIWLKKQNNNHNFFNIKNKIKPSAKLNINL